MHRRALVLALVALMMVPAWPSVPAVAAAPSATRTSGVDRIGTALSLARATYPDGAGTVVLARADVHVDALAGAPLAASLSAPLLLTPADHLRPDVQRAVAELGATRAVLLGGRAALAPHVVDGLRAAGVEDVGRMAGGSRIDTAGAIAREVAEVSPPDGVYVVQGESTDPSRGWADAVAVSALAAESGRPILLATRDGLPPATVRAVVALGGPPVTIVGGSAAVGDRTVAALRETGVSVSRLAGSSRWATSAEVARAHLAWRGGAADGVVAATGRDWADALAAGPAAAAVGAVLVLVDGLQVGGATPTERWLERHRDSLGDLVVVGGEGAVDPMVAEALRIDLSDPADLEVGVERATVIEQLTGRGSPNRTDRWAVHGTDLGHMFRHDGQLRMVFGDTFAADETDWRSNTMAVLDDTDPRDGLRIATMVTDRPGHAKELLGSRKVDGDEMTVIPTYGVSVRGRQYLHYMSVRSWNGPGVWDVRRSGMAYSDDGGRTWTKDPGVVWADGSGFAQVAMVRHGGSVYLFGIPEGRFGGVRLARVDERSLLDPGSYRYWDGAAWVADERAAARIVPGPVGELSVAYSGYLNRWVMTYLNEDRHAVVLRTSTALTGAWTDELGVAGSRRYPQLYAPYLVPGVETGRDLYFTMSRYDTYAVYLMRTSLTVRFR